MLFFSLFFSLEKRKKEGTSRAGQFFSKEKAPVFKFELKKKSSAFFFTERWVLWLKKAALF